MFMESDLSNKKRALRFGKTQGMAFSPKKIAETSVHLAYGLLGFG